MVLTAAVWPKWRVWTIDADRYLALERAQAAASWFGITADEVAATTLEGIGRRLHGTVEPTRALWPWIVAQGSRNRLRRAGLPFCPGCLAADEQPYFRLDWRIAWVVGCAHHRTRLLDRCDRCRAIVEPHRSVAATGDLAHCVQCGFDLRRSPCHPVDADAMEFQLLADDVFASGTGRWGNTQLLAPEWFHRARSLAVKDVCKIDSRGAAALGHRQIGLWLELQAPAEREARMRVLLSLIAGSSPPAMSAESREIPRRVGKSVARKRSFVLTPQAPVAKSRVQEDWARWLRRNRLW